VSTSRNPSRSRTNGQRRPSDRPSLCSSGGAFTPIALLAVLAVGCMDPAPPSARGRSAALSAALDELARVTLRLDADLRREDGVAVVRGAWGSAAGQFGKVDDASRPGPMSLAVGSAGELFVLDQVNRRISRFDRDGRVLAQIAIESETAEDLVVSGADVWVLYYEPGVDHGYRLRRHRDGGVVLDARLDRRLDLVTGLFASGEPSAPDLWIEQRHEQQLQVVARGAALPTSTRRPLVDGRPDPTRPGTRLLASRAGANLAVVDRVFPGRYTTRLLEIETPLPLVSVDDLLVDGAGGFYVSLMMAEETGADFAWNDARRVVVARRAGRAPVAIAMATERATDTFRTLAVDAEGQLHALESSEEGITVRRWSLENHVPPRALGRPRSWHGINGGAR
jgi:hypothetical protein